MPATKETLMPAEPWRPDAIDDVIANWLAMSDYAHARDAYAAAQNLREVLDGKGYDVTPRASQAATATNGPGDDAGAAHDPQRAAAGHTGARLREIFDAAFDATPTGSRWDEAVDAGIAAVIPAIRAQAVQAERERLAAMLHKRAQQSRTLTHRAALGIASRLVAPDITPEDLERAILDGNFVVCNIPDDPTEGDR